MVISSERPPKLLDQLRFLIRARHYGIRTELEVQGKAAAATQNQAPAAILFLYKQVLGIDLPRFR